MLRQEHWIQVRRGCGYESLDARFFGEFLQLLEIEVGPTAQAELRNLLTQHPVERGVSMGQRSWSIFLGKFDQGGQFLPPPLLELHRDLFGVSEQMPGR